jgi:hypothetical protein
MTRTVLVATDDGRDPSYAEMRRSVLPWLRDQDARVVLYDRAAESYFVDPYPSGTWTADVEGEPGRDRLLGPNDLEMLGRRYLADQVLEARAAGVDAHGWLPPKPGPAGMAEAVERFHVDLVILPAPLKNPSLLDRVRGNTLDRFRSVLSVPVHTADRDGIHQPTGVTATA